MTAKPKHEFVVRYKSGATVNLAADELSVTWNRAKGEVTALEWKNIQPRPLYAGLDNIESVWQVR